MGRLAPVSRKNFQTHRTSRPLALAFAEIPSHEKIIGEIKRTLAANKMPDNVHLRLMLTRVDGRQIGNGEVGAMTRKLAELFRRLTEIEGVSVV